MVSHVLNQSLVRWPIVLGSLVICALDWFVKTLILARLIPGETIPVIPGVFHITRTANTGAAFSLFYQHPEWLITIASLLFFAFLFWALTTKVMNRVEGVAFALVLGGTLGNLLDRIRYGAVVDFIDVRAIHYPIFNVADICIFIGMTMLVVSYFIRQKAA